jgi:hypothetical protein
VRRWVKRAQGRRLDRVDWRGHSLRPHRTRRTAEPWEELVLRTRRELHDQSDLGEYGAAAIARELTSRGLMSLPSVRTIGRILARCGVLDAHRRPRRRPPPLGWYLPAVAAHTAGSAGVRMRLSAMSASFSCSTASSSTTRRTRRADRGWQAIWRIQSRLTPSRAAMWC